MRRRQRQRVDAAKRRRERLAAMQVDLFDQSPVDFDVQAGRGERDRGMAQVEEHAREWKEEARVKMEAVVPPGWVGQGEDIRQLVLSAGLPPPHHPNCWGALTFWAVKRGLLEPTGDLDHMKDPRSHARYTKVYRRAPLVS